MKIWYTIEKSSNGYTVWKNKDNMHTKRGGFGVSKEYAGLTKKECIEYCKKNNIRVKKG